MKRLVVVMMMAVMVMVGCTSVAMADTKTASTRTMNGKVVEMYACDDTDNYIEVVIRTSDDNYWNIVVDKDTDLRIYTKVKVTFKTMGTSRKTDDRIKSVKIR